MQQDRENNHKFLGKCNRPICFMYASKFLLQFNDTGIGYFSRSIMDEIYVRKIKKVQRRI